MPRYVLITRHPSECHELQGMLDGTDLVLRAFPVLRLEDVNDRRGWRRMAKISTRADEGQAVWLVFASPRAPARFAALAKRHETGALLAAPVAAVGEGTAAAARDAGFDVTVTGPGTGVGLARQLVDLWGEPTTVVFACGHDRRDEMPAALETAGHRVVPVELYAMKPTPQRELPPLGPNLEAVVLTSPRSAHYYLEGVGGHPLPCQHWALGPTTRDAAGLMGIECRIPAQPNLSSLAEELCRI